MQKNKLAQVFHFDLFGRREDKYDFLLQHSINDIQWSELEVNEPNFFFVRKDFEGIKEYDKGFKIDELFKINSSGIKTHRDHFVIDFHQETLLRRINDFYNPNYSDTEVCGKFGLKDNRDWAISLARKIESYNPCKVTLIEYRPFDKRYCYYESSLIDFGRENVMRHFVKGANFGLSVLRQSRASEVGNYWINKNIIGKDVISPLDTCTVYPLYIYPEPNAQQTIDQPAGRVPNLNMEIVNQIAEKLGLSFVPEKNSPPSNGARNSPPLEGCPQVGVVGSPQPKVCSQGGVVVLTTINSTPIIRNFVENLPYNPALKQRARDKRKAGILSEVLFWQQVHKGMFHNIDFDRQRIIGNYIVDFYIKTLGLVVEIDGSSHDNKVEYDKIRQQFLESFGLKVYRIADIDVKKNLSWVMAELEKYIVKEYGECATPVYDHPTTPVFDHPSEGGEFAPVDLLDYIYAMLHSPSYREKYKEFLKIDFPRVPYPKDKATFWQLVELGGEIRQIHLLESPIVSNFITKYPVGGSNEVGKVRFEISENETRDSHASSFGKVWINDEQYFADVPQVAWEFFIGGYQPAQKWLKDRKGRELQIEDILHYQKIIVALSETDRLMKEIDQIDL